MDGAGVPDDRRRLLLRAALGFLQLPPRAPELQLLHRWLDTWTGVGLVVVGVERLGHRLSLESHRRRRVAGDVHGASDVRAGGIRGGGDTVAGGAARNADVDEAIEGATAGPIGSKVRTSRSSHPIEAADRVRRSLIEVADLVCYRRLSDERGRECRGKIKQPERDQQECCDN